MTSAEIEAALSAARGDVQRLQAELGGALLTGSDTAAIEKKLSKASAKLEEVERAASAIMAATRAAAEAKAVEQEREAQEALERRVQDAEADLLAIHKAAAGVDAALAGLDQALSDLAGLSDDFIAKHETLGIHSSVRQFFRLRGWCAEILTHMKNRGDRSMRNHMAQRQILCFGSGKNIADTIPEFAKALAGISKRKAAG